MSRTSVSILALTESCVSKFDNLLASYARGSQRIESLESRLADFNLWADGVGALAKPGASLDSRLQGRLNDLALVKNVLIMLADSLDHCVGLAKNETNYDETAHHEAIQNLDSAIKNLALIGVAIRRTGQASRNRRADKTFNPDNHQELRTHLECIIRLRPTEEPLFQQTENGGYVAKSDNPKLSDIQNRLVEANLRRRHKFLIAQKRSRNQRNVQIRPSIPEAPSPAGSVLKQEPLTDIRNADAAKNKKSTSYPTTRGHETTAPTISGFSLASTAEGTLRYTPAARKYTPSITKTQITFIASDVEFPKAPSIPLGREIMKCPCCCQSLPIGTFQNPKLWKQHIVEDLCPYTCIAENCPIPQLLFCTRNEWESHVKNTHLPRWQCPFCEEQNEDYSTMESMGCHLQDVHGEELLDNSLATLLSWSAVQTMGIKACPLCSSSGPEDSPELVDHVLRHAYDFALRALPWPQPVVYDLNMLPGCFTIPKDSDPMEDVQHWIRGAAHESVGSPEIQLSDYDGQDHSAPVPTSIFEYSDYFFMNAYFDDQSEDRSSKLQFNQSNASAYSTQSAQSHITSRVEDSVAFSADGRQVASAFGESVIRIWNIQTGQIIKRIKDHGSKIHLVAFSPYSQQLASASVDYNIKIWDTETEVCVQTLIGHNGTIKSMIFLPNYQELASVADYEAPKIWNTKTGQWVRTLESQIGIVTSMVFSPNSQQLASSGSSLDVRGRIWTWDITSARPGHTFAGHMDTVKSLAFSPTGQWLASASCDRTIKLWNMGTGECEWTGKSHDDQITSVAYSPDGRQLVSASLDSTIRLWDVAIGACLLAFNGHNTKFNSVIFSPDSEQLLSASDDNAIRVWDIATGTCIKTLMLKDHATEHIEGHTYPTHSDYTVGWVCALPKEQLAALYMLDHRHEDLPNPGDDDNTYVLGSISGHNVVIACPLISRTDKNDAKTTAQMISTFPNIKICLLVGTGSGISPEVRLGDIVVSCPADGEPAVLQLNMDNGKLLKHTGRLKPLPKTLLLILSKIEANRDSYAKKLFTYVNHVETRNGVPRNFVKSHLHEDLLFKPGYRHVSGILDSDDEEDSCRLCDKSMIVDRPLRDDNIMIHYGPVASANQIIGDATFREKLKELNKNILCVDTRAADFTNNFPGIVIRGICDYADSHKNKAWQEYAAVTAAACAKAFLTVLSVDDVDKMEIIEDIVPLDIVDNSAQEYDTREMAQRQAEHDEAHTDGVDTKLHDAVRNGETEAVEFLLNHGANVQAKNNYGETPLHYAAFRGQVDVAKLLLSHGANIEAENDYGNTPLHKAALNGQVDIAKLLLSHGANVKAENNNGETPLHYAAFAGVTEVSKLLLEQGASINAQDVESDTPLHVATRRGEIDLARILVEQGADMNTENTYGDTALSIAIETKQENIIKFLQEQGNGSSADAKV